MPKAKSKFSHVTWLRQREISYNFPLGTRDNFHTRLYSSIYAVGSWDHQENLRNAVHGGVFNLEFSPDGKLLVAACEKKSILMFDPLSQRMINGIDDAHTECVNCVRFLDSRVFATCSDDTTVALWDARNLKQRIHTLRGHKNWVKNIEFSAKDGLLVTSGFDGSIYTWDINNYSEKRVFHTNGLMRTRLNPDASKMIICTTGGYLMIIHDLDLANLATDLAGFKPNMYRLMQQNQAIYPGGVDFTYLFSARQKRNRVEFITDFPKGVDAEVISSLQVHPQGWCALSRNVNNDESSEWTCVHDIQERPEAEETDEEEGPDRDPSPPRRATLTLPAPQRRPDDDESRRIRRVGEIVRRGGTYTANVELHVSSSDVWEAIVAVREARMSRQREREAPAPPPPPAQDGRANRFAILVNRHLEEEGVAEGSRNVTGDPRGQAAGSPVIIFRELAVGGSPVRRRTRPLPRNVHRIQETTVPGDFITSPPTPGGVVRPPAVPTVNYEALASALRRNEELRAARLAEVHEIDINQQMPILHGLAATMVQTLAGRDGRLPARTINVPAGDGSVDISITTRSSSSSSSQRTTPFSRSTADQSDQSGARRCKVHRRYRVHQNVPRLLNYIEEPNVGKGFIKELCFSSDGRLICSPFAFGVRLLAFTPNCAELSTSVPLVPTQLFELKTNICHGNTVVSTKFSPQHCLLVSGCLNGKIVWHQPNIW